MTKTTEHVLRGDRVKLLREALQWTQADLSDHCGVSRVAITMMEKNRGGATLRVLVALATALHTTSDYLIGLSDNPGMKWEQRIEKVKKIVLVEN